MGRTFKRNQFDDDRWLKKGGAHKKPRRNERKREKENLNQQDWWEALDDELEHDGSGNY